MVTRTAKLYGTTYPESDDSVVTVKVLFGGTEVYSGPAIPVDNISDYGSTLAIWQFDGNIHGTVPIVIEVDGGSLTFVNILMNYTNIEKTYSLNTNATWPKAVPSKVEDLSDDHENLSDEEFVEKYSVDKNNLIPDYVIETVENVFNDPNNNDINSDGKTNVKINGVSKTRNVIDPTQLGEWHWIVPNKGKLEFDFAINPPDLD
jgi:hypothetical protein